MLDVAQPLMAAAPRLVSALLSGFAAPAPRPTIRGFAAYFNAYTLGEGVPSGSLAPAPHAPPRSGKKPLGHADSRRTRSR